MELHLHAVPRSETPFYCETYIQACAPPSDPTIIWGSEFDMAPLREYLHAQRLQSQTFLSPAHVLLRAVAKAIHRHPELNRRIVRRSVFAFRDINILTTITRPQDREVGVVLLRNVDTLSLDEIARVIWWRAVEHQRNRGDIHRDLRRVARVPRFLFGPLLRLYIWLQRNLRIACFSRFDRLFNASVLVNCLDFANTAPMKSYKPAIFPTPNGVLNVTMGPPRKQPLVRGDEVVVGEVAPIFVRADHRTIDAQLLAKFITSITEFMTQPELMEADGSSDPPVDTETPARKAA